MKILDIPISEKNYKDILSDFSGLSKGYVCVTSVHGLIEAYENTNVKKLFIIRHIMYQMGCQLFYLQNS